MHKRRNKIKMGFKNKKKEFATNDVNKLDCSTLPHTIFRKQKFKEKVHFGSSSCGLIDFL